MDNMIKKGKDEVKKYSIFSTHSSNITPLLLFFNLTSADCLEKKWKNQTVQGNCADIPDFSSSLIF